MSDSSEETGTKRIGKKIRRLERERIVKSKLEKIKESDLLESLEEVFDYSTLMALYELLNEGAIDIIHGVVAAGKEARIYWAEDPKGRDVALKIFLVSTAEFRNLRKYINGDPRFRRVRRDRRHLMRAWCSKEFKNLILAGKAGVRVPRPIAFNKNVLVMDFISYPGVRGRPAPLLKAFPPENPVKAFEVVSGYIKALYDDAELIHSDLSEYNVMHRDGEYVVIDWGSAVLKSHPNAEEFLRRDVARILYYFRRLDVKVPDEEELLTRITG